MKNPAAYRLYLIYSAVTSLLFALIFTVMAVYRMQVAGLNPLQLVLVGTVLEIAYFAFNVPTGILADTHSRRWSVIIGVFLFAVGFGLEGLVPSFGAILLAQVIEGLAYTFVEGTLEAWLADEVGEEELGRVLLRGGQIGGVSGFVGIFASVALGSIGLALPIVAGGVLFGVLGVYLLLAMREPGFQRPEREERSGLSARMQGVVRDMTGTLRSSVEVVRHRALARTILGIAFVFGGFSEGWDRLWEAHFLQSITLPRLGSLDPVVWFGIINAGSTLLSVGASGIARRRLNLQRADVAIRALFAIDTLLVAGVAAFALAGAFPLALAAFWLASVMRSLEGPVYSAWINQGINPRVRATVLSMSGQANALGQFTVGPGIGGLGTIISLRVALAVAAAALSPALLLYGRALKRPSAGYTFLPTPRGRDV